VKDRRDFGQLSSSAAGPFFKMIRTMQKEEGEQGKFEGALEKIDESNYSKECITEVYTKAVTFPILTSSSALAARSRPTSSTG
jgi:hypothetical protein